jgi:hypothetical protein
MAIGERVCNSLCHFELARPGGAIDCRNSSI